AGTLLSSASHPDVAMDSVGNFAVVWTAQAGTDLSSRDVKGARYAADGTKLGSFSVVTTAGKAEYDPSIAMDANGNFVVSYTTPKTSDPADTDIVANLYYANGAPPKPLYVNYGFSHDPELNSRVAMAPDGRIALAHEAHDSSSYPSSSRIVLNLYTA